MSGIKAVCHQMEIIRSSIIATININIRFITGDLAAGGDDYPIFGERFISPAVIRAIVKGVDVTCFGNDRVVLVTVSRRIHLDGTVGVIFGLIETVVAPKGIARLSIGSPCCADRGILT